MSDTPFPSSNDTPAPSPLAAPASGDVDVRELVFMKNGQRFVFRYERGAERSLLGSLAEMARDPDSPLDWFDAATLSHQLGQSMQANLQTLSPQSQTQTLSHQG